MVLKHDCSPLLHMSRYEHTQRGDAHSCRQAANTNTEICQYSVSQSVRGTAEGAGINKRFRLDFEVIKENKSSTACLLQLMLRSVRCSTLFSVVLLFPAFKSSKEKYDGFI